MSLHVDRVCAAPPSPQPLVPPLSPLIERSRAVRLHSVAKCQRFPSWEVTSSCQRFKACSLRQRWWHLLSFPRLVRSGASRPPRPAMLRSQRTGTLKLQADRCKEVRLLKVTIVVCPWHPGAGPVFEPDGH